MELMEPIAVNVVLPSGEQVAQLMVNPEKPIMQMKTQIAGLEGTPVANQVLLLNDQQVEDVDTLRGLNVSSEATFLLLRRAPLLSGAINRDELEHLLEDNLALEQAIVAYSESLQYLPSDITTISEEVTEGLVACGSGHDKATLLSGRQVEVWQDIAKQTGKARQVAFSRALRQELERIHAALPVGPVPHAVNHPRRSEPFAQPKGGSEPSVAGEPTQPTPATPATPAMPVGRVDQSEQPEPLAPPAPTAQPLQPRVAPKSASHYMQPLRPTPERGEVSPQPTGALDDLSLRHIDVQKDEARFASHPWMGVARQQLAS